MTEETIQTNESTQTNESSQTKSPLASFVLIGPYTSSRFTGHNLNMGRLYTYYLYSTITFPDYLIHCLPLLTAGYDYIDQWSAQDFSKCLALCDISVGGLLTPLWQSSTGARVERHHIASTKGSGVLVELPVTKDWHWRLFREVENKLTILQSYNPIAYWARLYLDNHSI